VITRAGSEVRPLNRSFEAKPLAVRRTLKDLIMTSQTRVSESNAKWHSGRAYEPAATPDDTPFNYEKLKSLLSSYCEQNRNRLAYHLAQFTPDEKFSMNYLGIITYQHREREDEFIDLLTEGSDSTSFDIGAFFGALMTVAQAYNVYGDKSKPFKLPVNLPTNYLLEMRDIYKQHGNETLFLQILSSIYILARIPEYRSRFESIGVSTIHQERQDTGFNKIQLEQLDELIKQNIRLVVKGANDQDFLPQIPPEWMEIISTISKSIETLTFGDIQEKNIRVCDEKTLRKYLNEMTEAGLISKKYGDRKGCTKRLRRGYFGLFA
jgi:hypothetical protein